MQLLQGPESADSLNEESVDSLAKIEEMLAEEAAQLGATIEDDAKEARGHKSHDVEENAKKDKRQVSAKAMKEARGHKRHEVVEDAKKDKAVPERQVKSAKTMPVEKGTKVIMAARASARTKALPAGKAMPRPLKKPAAALKRPAAATEKVSADDKTSARSVHPHLGQISMNNDQGSSRIRAKDKDNIKWFNLCNIAGSVPHRVQIANLVWRWMLSDAMTRKKMTKEMIIAKKDSICKEVNDAAAEDSEDDEDDEDDDDDDDSDE